MNIFQERRYWRKILSSRPVIWFSLLIIFFLTFKVFGIMTDVLKINKEIKNKENETVRLIEKSALLKENMESIREGIYAEKELREKFNVKKAGEQTIIIVDDGSGEYNLEKSRAQTFISWLKDLFSL